MQMNPAFRHIARDAFGACASHPGQPRRHEARRNSFSFLAGLAVSCLFLMALCIPLACLAAELRWQSLADRERISIRLGNFEGIPGQVARIAPTAILVPFTKVPPALVVNATPKKAVLFKNSSAEGRSLALHTQTPEFGFFVNQKSPQELEIDLFHNPLGARWRPIEAAPTTEKQPDTGLQDTSLPNENAIALENSPAKDSLPNSQPVPQESAPAAQEPVPTAQNAPPERQNKPTVVELSGSPLHAAEVTAQAPPASPASPAPQSMLQQAAHTGIAGAAPSTPVPAASGNAPVAVSDDPSVAVVPTASGNAPAAVSDDPPVAVAPSSSGQDKSAPAAAGMATRVGPALYRGLIDDGRQPPAENGQQQPQTRPTPDASFNRQTASGEPEQREIPDQATSAQASPPEAAEPRTAVGTAPIPQAPAPPLESTGSPSGPGNPPVPAQSKGDLPTRTEEQKQHGEKGSEGMELSPPSLNELLSVLRETLGKNDHASALSQAEALLGRDDLTREQREELLHIKAETLFSVHKDDLTSFFTPISDATTQAINFNMNSHRTAGALLRLGYMNLKVNNIPEANANFNLLRRRFPDDANVPLSYFYWGERYLEQNDLQKAADEFQIVLQKYPNSLYAREAALGLARSFYRLEYYDQAYTIVKYMEKRWERFYLDSPPFLRMMGDVAYRLDKPEESLDYYWLYMNLTPNGEEADIMLTRIGDIYSARRETAAAKEMYQESIKRFPDRDGGLIAMMRLAENGINDNPSIAGMLSVFDGPLNFEALRVYQTIIAEHSQSGLVPLAKIKLAMWHLWKREFTAALDEVSDLLQKYPEHELAAKAKEIAMQAFSVLSSDSVEEGNYNRMHEIWERYPIVHDQGELLSPGSRIALGVSYWKDGMPNEALDAVTPFFLGKRVPEYSEMALSLVLSIYLEFDQWQSVLKVADKVALWEIKSDARRQLDYALALAYENLSLTAKAWPIWQKLYDSNELPPTQKAYATFFLARHMEKERDLEKAFSLGKEALGKLREEAERSDNPADINKIKSQLASLMDIAETAGHQREALAFAEQYLQYLGEDETERTSVRYRMARIHKKQGDLDSWRKILTELAARNPDSVYGKIAASELKAAAIAEDAARFSPTGKL